MLIFAVVVDVNTDGIGAPCVGDTVVDVVVVHNADEVVFNDDHGNDVGGCDVDVVGVTIHGVYVWCCVYGVDALSVVGCCVVVTYADIGVVLVLVVLLLMIVLVVRWLRMLHVLLMWVVILLSLMCVVDGVVTCVNGVNVVVVHTVVIAMHVVVVVVCILFRLLVWLLLA